MNPIALRLIVTVAILFLQALAVNAALEHGGPYAGWWILTATIVNAIALLATWWPMAAREDRDREQR